MGNCSDSHAYGSDRPKIIRDVDVFSSQPRHTSHLALSVVSTMGTTLLNNHHRKCESLDVCVECVFDEKVGRLCFYTILCLWIIVFVFPNISTVDRRVHEVFSQYLCKLKM